MQFRWLNPTNILVGLVVLHSAMLAYMASVMSPTFDEPGLLVAGISHCHYQRFDLYHVNPPLVRIVAAIPVVIANPKTEWGQFHVGPGARPEFKMGEDFVAANGKRSMFLFMIARWACIPFCCLGMVVLYRWGCELGGSVVGLLAATLWCFSPNLLGHGSLMTNDVPATSMALWSTYTFRRWNRTNTWWGVLTSGGVLGLSLLTKFTLLLLVPMFLTLFLCRRAWLGELISFRSQRFVWWQFGSIFAVAWLVVNFGYEFEGTGTRLGELPFVSQTLSTKVGAKSVNRFAGTVLESWPIPIPSHYLLGIDSQRKDFERWKHPFYLHGQLSTHGWWYYYLYGFLVKGALGTWGLLGLAIVYRVSRIVGTCRVSPNPLSPNPPVHERPCIDSRERSGDEGYLLFPLFLFLGVVSSQTGLNENLRYAFPCLPFAYLWMSWHTVGQMPFIDRIVGWGGNVRRLVPYAFVLGTVGSCMSTFPHSLCYFNELAGGPSSGCQHMLGSNFDWGQNLGLLEKWHIANGNDRTMHVLASAGYSPDLWSPRFKRFDNVLETLSNGTTEPVDLLAISLNYLYGEEKKGSLPQWCIAHQPIGKVGHTIVIYEYRKGE